MQPLPRGEDLVKRLTRYGKPLDHYKVITITEAKTFPHDRACPICIDVKARLENLDPTMYAAITFDWHLVGIIG